MLLQTTPGQHPPNGASFATLHRMCVENNGEPFDITSGFWKAWTISEVIGNHDYLAKLRSRCVTTFPWARIEKPTLGIL